MKKWTKFISIAKILAVLVCAGYAGQNFAADARTNFSNQKIGVVNFKECVEKSKMGKQEQAAFEALKKHAEQMMIQKEKEVSEIASKLHDSDYMDSLSQQAEAELKHKYRTLTQEYTQAQQQLYQSLSQANYKILQKLTEEVNKAAKNVANSRGLDFIQNEDASFYYNDKYDVTDLIVEDMDARFEAEPKKSIGK
jgi:outer membrane protein